MPEKMNLYFGDMPSPECDKDLVNWHEVDVATADELLEFVNKGREAGGADILEALLPSQPDRPQQCLIANALNFGCSVRVCYTDSPYNIVRLPSGAWQWKMILPLNMSDEDIERIANALGVERNDHDLLLPESIGNAARAFDSTDAFKEFRIK